MKVLYYIQCSCLIALTALAATALIYWHPWNAPMVAEQDWEYQTFQWHEMDFDEDGHPGQVYASFVHMDGNETLDGKEGRQEPTLDNLLNTIGIYGWELVCYDGKNYIVKRRYNQTTAHDFYVEQHWKRIAARTPASAGNQ